MLFAPSTGTLNKRIPAYSTTEKGSANPIVQYNSSDGQVSDKILAMRKSLLSGLEAHPEVHNSYKKVWDLYSDLANLTLKYTDLSTQEEWHLCLVAAEFYVRFTLEYGLEAVTPYVHTQGAYTKDMLGRKYPLGRMKQELMERWHRAMKDVADNFGGGINIQDQDGLKDRLGFFRQFKRQYAQGIAILQGYCKKDIEYCCPTKLVLAKWDPLKKADVLGVFEFEKLDTYAKGVPHYGSLALRVGVEEEKVRHLHANYLRKKRKAEAEGDPAGRVRAKRSCKFDLTTEERGRDTRLGNVASLQRNGFRRGVLKVLPSNSWTKENVVDYLTSQNLSFNKKRKEEELLPLAMKHVKDTLQFNDFGSASQSTHTVNVTPQEVDVENLETLTIYTNTEASRSSPKNRSKRVKEEQESGFRKIKTEQLPLKVNMYYGVGPTCAYPSNADLLCLEDTT